VVNLNVKYQENIDIIKSFYLFVFILFIYLSTIIVFLIAELNYLIVIGCVCACMLFNFILSYFLYQNIKMHTKHGWNKMIFLYKYEIIPRVTIDI